ncbi:MAG TPA: DUF58 domain-containing protein [Bryobacteraceae bacterium]|nr:DUF58 domain-containing protein [Bryobacteraceae bacterium]
MIRPTRKAVLLFAGVLPVPWLLLSYRPEWWPFAFEGSLLVLIGLGVDAVLARPRRQIQARVDAPEIAYVGDSMHAAITLTGSSVPAQYEIALDVQAAVPTRVAGSAEAGGVAIPLRQRGQLTIESLWMRWRGPFGLIEETRRFPVDRKVAVVPNTLARRGEDLALYFRDALFGAKVQRGWGEGSEFESLREYAPGLDPRFIDWKHSARHRKMLVREFRAERNHPIVLAFDTGHLMREPVEEVPRLDHALGSGLLLARVALGAGDLVGLYGFDSRTRYYTPPVRGTHTFRRLQESSAELHYSADETNFTLGMAELQARLPRRSLIVLFTDFVDTITAELLFENVRRLVSRHLLVFVTIRDNLLAEVFDGFPGDNRQIARAVLADDFRRDRGVVLEKLERLGVHCIDLPPSEVPVALLNHYLVIKQRGLL